MSKTAISFSLSYFQVLTFLPSSSLSWIPLISSLINVTQSCHKGFCSVYVSGASVSSHYFNIWDELFISARGGLGVCCNPSSNFKSGSWDSLSEVWISYFVSAPQRAHTLGKKQWNTCKKGYTGWILKHFNGFKAPVHFNDHGAQSIIDGISQKVGVQD